MADERQRVITLIAVTALVRLALAGSIGLGVDESYAFAVSRPFSASYFDHPPLAFWIVGAMRSMGTSPILLRAPFIALFAATTWLFFQTTARVFDARAGYWAAVVVTLAPVFTISSASWIVPDGPLLLGLALASYAAARIRFESAIVMMRDWCLLGAGVGLAALSKYHAILFVAGLLFWCATDARSRRCLASPGALVAILVASALALPVFIWNAQHDWVSFRFRLSRTGGTESPLIALAQNLGGQAAYLLPWIWVPMVVALARAAKRGPRDERSWFFFCVAIVPIALFTMASLRGSPGLPHWPAPGYFFVAPLVGRDIATIARRRPGAVRWGAALGAAALLIPVTIAASQARTGWLSDRLPSLVRKGDPSLDLLDWRSLKPGLARAGIENNRVVVGTSWIECAKIAYALAGSAPVRCASEDPRHFRYLPSVGLPGDDVLVLSREHAAEPGVRIPIMRAGRAVFFVQAYLSPSSTVARAPAPSQSARSRHSP